MRVSSSSEPIEELKFDVEITQDPYTKIEKVDHCDLFVR